MKHMVEDDFSSPIHLLVVESKERCDERTHHLEPLLSPVETVIAPTATITEPPVVDPVANFMTQPVPVPQPLSRHQPNIFTFQSASPVAASGSPPPPEPTAPPAVAAIAITASDG